MATKARLHWFWQGMIAALIGAAAGTGWVTLIVATRHTYWLSLAHHVLVDGMRFPQYVGWSIAYTVFLGALAVLMSLAISELLASLQEPKSRDDELHCCHCNYILRGLSEPRCPECGEMI
jgi:hypothetical protein